MSWIGATSSLTATRTKASSARLLRWLLTNVPPAVPRSTRRSHSSACAVYRLWPRCAPLAAPRLTYAHKVPTWSTRVSCKAFVPSTAQAGLPARLRCGGLAWVPRAGTIQSAYDTVSPCVSTRREHGKAFCAGTAPRCRLRSHCRSKTQ